MPLEVAKYSRCTWSAGFALIVDDETVISVPPFVVSVKAPSASEVTVEVPSSAKPLASRFVTV